MQLEQQAARSGLWEGRRSYVIDQSLDHLLAMARRYHSEGNMWQATEMYWMLLEDHAGTAQSLEAQNSLLELAAACERDDERHMARAVYERLSDLV
jgi:hypothetical protein